MSLDDVQVHLVDSLDTAMEFKRWASETRPYIAVDTETTGLGKYTGDRVRLCQIGDARTGWAIPWEDWGGVAKEILSEWGGRVLMHNATFDMAFLHTWISWGQVDDTRTLAWLHDPTRPTALKNLSDRYVDPRASALQSQLDDAMGEQKWTWATVPVAFQPYWAYGALDTVLTSQIWEYLQHQGAGRFDKAYQLELGVLPVLQRMEARGAAVDVEYASARKIEFLERVDQWKAWAEEAHGVSLTANQQVVSRMQELGVDLWKQTPKGAWSMDKEVIEELLVHPTEAVRHLALAKQEVGRLLKLSSAYLDHFVNDSVDGMIHGSINPLGARTSRMSISQPSLQNLPRANKENLAAIEVRNCFVSAYGENGRLAMCDYDQIELRLTGHYANDPDLLEILQDRSLDPFTEFAKKIYEDPTITKKDPRRGFTKNTIYATLYGAGVAKISATAGIAQTQGEAFMASYYNNFPGVKTFQRSVEQKARQRLSDEGVAYVQTPYGHKITSEDDKTYALVNYLIQGFAANLMKQALINMDNAGIGEYMVLPVHDEIILDAPTEDIEDVMHTASEAMADMTTYRCPLPVGSDGPFNRWGEKYLQ